MPAVLELFPEWPTYHPWVLELFSAPPSRRGPSLGWGKGKGQKPFEAGGGVGQDSGVSTAEIKRGFSSSKRGASVLVSPCQSSGQALLPLQYLFPIAFAGCRCRKWVA